MQVLVVYESMYGNTHLVAERIAAGLAPVGTVQLLPVHDATPDVVRAADLVVMGGPTHVHGMSSHMSRQSAVEAVHEPDAVLHLDPDAEGPGVRDLLESLGRLDRHHAAAFDTRVDASPLLTGRASKGIARKLEHHGFTLVAEPESFLVDKQTHLEDGEAQRAEAWGAALAALVMPPAVQR